MIDAYAESHEVREISIGDYVLNGGEVAALAIVESVIRLLPGFMGNPASLVEESHEDGLLEYPVYTKPAVGAVTRSPPCCCPVITVRSRPGAMTRQYAAQPIAAPTSCTRAG